MNSPLEVYNDNGFKFIHCNQDKTPKRAWRNPENHLTFDVAKELQRTGEMIGAIIPEDIVVLDLDNHEGKSNGIATFRDIKEKYNITYNIINDTFTVATANNGYHIFLYVGKNHKYTQGEKAPGIDLKTDAGYVIAAGSPGYRIHPDVLENDIAEITDELRIWLDHAHEKIDRSIKKKKVDDKSLIPVDLLRRVLAKLDVKKFDSNDSWYELIVSAIAAAGDSEEVIDALAEWSSQDPRYDLRDSIGRIKSFEQQGGITAGTFIHILRTSGISQYFIKKILSFNTSVELYENMRDDGHPLPFPEPDYESISESKEANELFLTAGNSVAATLLGFAIQEHIIYCEADREFYLFDGNMWSEFYDMYSVAYTVLMRLSKFMYAKKKGSETDNENFIKLVKAINKTRWKKDTIEELKIREGVYQKKAQWDPEKIKETVTTKDGVIDFTGDSIEIRSGRRDELRKSYVPYTCDEIMNAAAPLKYNEFLESLFPDKETLFTARQASSLYISGNAKKIFQVFHGAAGDNGKSTWIEIEIELLGPEKACAYSTGLILSNKYGDDKLPPEAADFAGKYLLFGSEVQKGKQLSLGKIKNLTGGDTIAATPKYKDQRTFRPTWQMILSINDLPFFDGTDRAFINRLLIIPFEKTFVDDEEKRQELIKKGFSPESVSLKRDPESIKAEIRKEFPGVIKQKILDYIQLKTEYRGVIKQSRKCRAHKESYITDNNDIGSFLEEMCVISVDGDLFETTEKLTESYKEYSGNYKASARWVALSLKKERQELIDETRIVTEYENHISTGIKYEKKVRRRGFRNIRIKDFNSEKDVFEEELNRKKDDGIPF